jgi:hypothetical protein
MGLQLTYLFSCVGTNRTLVMPTHHLRRQADRRLAEDPNGGSFHRVNLTMKKLLIILGSLFALMLIGGLIASFFLGTIVTTGINRFAPSVTGTPVTLESCSISPLTGSGTLNGLFVGNTTGWKSPKAFSFSTVHVSVAPLSLIGDHIIIKDVLIDGPEFVFETNIIRNNISDLLANIEKFTSGMTGGTPTTPAEKSAAPIGKPLKFEVKNFRLQNVKVTVGVGSSALTLDLPPIALTDLGTAEGGITPDQLATKVLSNVLDRITAAAGDSLLKGGGATGDAATNAAKKATEGLKKLLGGNK